jgi:sugar lactone lactonase YvrE
MVALCLWTGQPARAQQVSVTSGSVVPFTHSSTWTAVSNIRVAHNGNVLFMDWANQGALYQLAPGATTPTTVMAPILSLSTHTWWTYGMALDSHDTLYIADTFGDSGNQFYCVPYDSKTGTWDMSTSMGWGKSVEGDSVEPYGIAVDDKDNLVVTTYNGGILYIPVTQPSTSGSCGTPGTDYYMVKGLKNRALPITVDHAGNVYFIEDPTAKAASSLVEGIYVVPPGSQLQGASDGTLEPTLTRLDPASAGYNFDGLTVDKDGNLYVSGSTSQNRETMDLVLKVPNEGTPTAPNLVWDDTVQVAPVSAISSIAIDPTRGVLWIPSASTGWQPAGSTVYPGTGGVVEWTPGAVNLASTPLGTPGGVNTLFYSFSKATTPATIQFSQPGGKSDFTLGTYPYAVGGTTAPTTLPSCTAGTQYQPWPDLATSTSAVTYCANFIALNPSVPGALSGEMQMFDGSGSLIDGSVGVVNGIGQGAAASILSPAAIVQVATGLSAPGQVATDGVGNSYVADSGLGQVVVYAAGASAATGTPVVSGLTALSGVAVDGSGDVYYGNSGSVYGIPFVGGKLWPASTVTLASGLGKHLSLAADGSGDVFVADADNAQVVKILNQTLNTLLVNAPTVTVGSGFTSPSAIATDGSGNVYVADGTNLIEVMPNETQSAITNSLSGSVTGLAIEPSGSVYVAQKGGILRIPNESGSLTFNDAALVAQDLVSSPSGLAMDRFGNLFVSYGSGDSASLAQVGIGGSLNVGQVSPYVTSDPQNAQVFNIGNLDLTFNAVPVLSGTDANEFEFVSANGNACDTSGTTSVSAGESCYLAVTLTAEDVGTRTASAAISSNAGNTSSLPLALQGSSVGNLTKSQVALSISPSGTLTYPANATITATVSSTVSGDTNVPTGNVVLTLNGVAVGSAQTLENGVASFTLSTLKGGTYTAKVTYKGDKTFGGSAQTVTITVNQVTPTITSSTPDTYIKLKSTYNITVKVTSSVGTPTGTVAFMNGSQLADPTQSTIPVDADGNATFNTDNLALGQYSLTAVYSGDVNYATANSSPITFQIVNPSVLITASPASLTVKAGVASSTTLTLESIVGFNASVTLGCVASSLPQYSECTFDNPVPTVSNKGGNTTVVVTLSTNVPVNTASARELNARSFGLSLAGLFGVGILGLWRARKRGLRSGLLSSLCLALLLSGGMLGVTACNNNGYTKTPAAPHVTTPSGTYTVSITGVNPASQATVTLPFTVNVTVQ